MEMFDDTGVFFTLQVFNDFMPSFEAPYFVVYKPHLQTNDIQWKFCFLQESLVVVRGQSPTICDATYKYHLSWFPNMCISNIKAEQNNLWSPVAVDTIIFAKKNATRFNLRAPIFENGMPHALHTMPTTTVQHDRASLSFEPPNIFIFLRLWQTLDPKKSVGLAARILREIATELATPLTHL